MGNDFEKLACLWTTLLGIEVTSQQVRDCLVAVTLLDINVATVDIRFKRRDILQSSPEVAQCPTK